jgi:hypothetical protein
VSETKRKYDSTVARVAGNIASGMVRDRDESGDHFPDEAIAEWSVSLARAIVEEVQRTEPEAK